MNTYIIPYSTDSECKLLCIKAANYSTAKEKAVGKFADKFEFMDYAFTFEEALDELAEHNIIVGDIYDIEEFN